MPYKVLFEKEPTCDECCEIIEPFTPIYRDDETDTQYCKKCLFSTDDAIDIVDDIDFEDDENASVFKKIQYYTERISSLANWLQNGDE